MIALYFDNNELAELSQAITHYKMSSYYFGESEKLNNAENKIDNALYDFMISDMEEEESCQ